MARVALKVEKGECDNCLKTFPGWALYRPLKSEDCEVAICGACIASKAAAKTTAKVANTVAPWETEAGKFAKAQRNLALDGSLWAVMPGSPLTLACQAEWIAYRATLNRMTVDCADPAEWVWPEPPKNEYPAISATGTVKLSGAK